MRDRERLRVHIRAPRRRSATRLVDRELHRPVLVLAALGAEFEVESPDELRRHLRKLGELFLRSSQPD